MPLDISDAESSFLYGKAEFDEWMMKFNIRWNMPDILLSMAAAVKAAGTQGMLQNPEAIIKTDALVKKLTGRE
jgi:hypothetical protein